MARLERLRRCRHRRLTHTYTPAHPRVCIHTHALVAQVLKCDVRIKVVWVPATYRRRQQR